MPQRKNRLLDFLFISHRAELVAFAEQKASAQQAEDLVQDAFLRLLQHGDIENIDNHRAYLYKVTANVGVNQFRRQPPVDFLDDSGVDPDSLICPLPQPDTVNESRETYELCMQALDALPVLVRTVFLLHRVDGMAQADIGKAFNLPLRTVERYCAKALAHCCQALDKP